MTINYKDKMYIHHPDGKFTEEQIKKILGAAYEMGKQDGYNDGYEAGKKNSFTITYPSYPWTGPYYNPSITYPYTDWWKSPWYTTASGDTISVTGTNITPMSITTTSNPSSTTTTTACTNKGNCNSCSSINCTPTKSESPYGMEFKYNGTEK